MPERLAFHRKSIDLLAREGDPAIEAWIHAWNPVADARPMFGEDGFARVTGEIWHANGVTLNRFRMSGQTLHRTEAHLALCSELISVQRVVEGRGRGVMDGAAFEQCADLFTVLDWCHPYTNVHTRCLVEGIILPKALVGFRPAPGQGVPTIDCRTGQGRVLAHELTSTLDRLEAGSRIDLERLINILRACIADRPQGQAQRRAVSAGRDDAIRAYIEAHLSDRTLNADHIVRTFGVTRRTLYRVFESSGGVRAYIQERRLNRAIADLGQPRSKRGQIGAIATRWGFSSEAAFSRAVRKRLGVPPSRMLELKTPPGSRPWIKCAINEWLRTS
ncbi:MAG: helix-turn-helix domain-containing protein [Pseudomonadota bacterium]